MIKHNIDIPDKIKNSSDLGKITSNIIKTSVNKHDYVFTYNYDKMQEYADSIKEVVKSYSNTETLSIQSSYSLKYNTVKDSNGNWVTSGGAYDARWLNYNCAMHSQYIGMSHHHFIRLANSINLVICQKQVVFQHQIQYLI